MVFLASLTYADQGFTNTLPNCASSESDSDGDGYGWENNKSCVVASASGVCEDRGDYPWGWNPVSKTSCRLDAADTSNDVIDSVSNTPAETGICIDSDGDGYGWNGTDTCDPGSSDTTDVSAPMFTNLATGESVALTAAYWNDTDFYKPLTCFWSSFDGTDYVVQAGSLYTHNALSESGTGFITIESGSPASRNWSLQSGIYTSPVNPTGSPWIEYEGNGVRFWIDNESFVHCRALISEDSFIPSGTGMPSFDFAPDDTNLSSGECIDPDGDGIGDDGFISCRVSNPSDASWEFCGTELPFGQTWGSQQSHNNTNTSCVRRCGATATELPNTPGWSYDPEAAAECVVDEFFSANSTAALSVSANVAVYDISASGTERQLFEDQFAYPLYHGGSTWECSQQIRESNNEEFSSIGVPRIIQFDTSFGGNWYFDRRQWKQILTIDDSDVQGESFEYTGYAQIHHDSLTLYKTSYDRLSCTRSGPAQDLTLPTNISEFQRAESLFLNDLLDQSFQCRLLEGLSRGQNQPSDVGWQAAGIEESAFNTELTFNPTFYSLNDAGEALYQSTAGYLITSRGERNRIVSPAFGAFRFGGNRFFSSQYGTSSIYNHLLAKRIGNNIMLERHYFSRISGGGFDTLSYYVCPVTN